MMNGVLMDRETYWEFLQKQSGAIKEEDDHDHAKCVLAFQLDQDLFGIDCLDIVEVIRTREVSIQPVPRTKPGVLGIFNLRGEIIPVVDFESKWRQLNNPLESSTFPMQHQRIIIVNVKGIQAGLLVAGVLGLVVIDESKSKPTDFLGISSIVYNEDKGFKRLNLAFWL